MDNKEQREFLSNLTRTHINQLCLEMQSIISNTKLFLAATHGYTEPEITKIMMGITFEDLDTRGPAPSSRTEDQAQNTEPTHTAKPFVQRIPQDLTRLKQEDEMTRRSMLFELEWCVDQIERGIYPH